MGGGLKPPHESGGLAGRSSSNLKDFLNSNSLQMLGTKSTISQKLKIATKKIQVSEHCASFGTEKNPEGYKNFETIYRWSINRQFINGLVIPFLGAPEFYE